MTCNTFLFPAVCLLQPCLRSWGPAQSTPSLEGLDQVNISQVPGCRFLPQVSRNHQSSPSPKFLQMRILPPTTSAHSLLEQLSYSSRTVPAYSTARAQEALKALEMLHLRLSHCRGAWNRLKWSSICCQLSLERGVSSLLMAIRRRQSHSRLFWGISLEPGYTFQSISLI